MPTSPSLKVIQPVAESQSESEDDINSYVVYSVASCDAVH